MTGYTRSPNAATPGSDDSPASEHTCSVGQAYGTVTVALSPVVLIENEPPAAVA